MLGELTGQLYGIILRGMRIGEDLGELDEKWLDIVRRRVIGGMSLVISSRSKIGPHDLVPNAASLKLVEAGWRGVKLVSGNLGAAREYLSANPGLLIIGRNYTSHTAREDWAAGQDPAISAWRFVGSQRATYDANPLIKYWEGFNEPSFG